MALSTVAIVGLKLMAEWNLLNTTRTASGFLARICDKAAVGTTRPAVYAGYWSS